MPPPWINQLTNVKKTAAGWQACCPAHEDNSPSLSIALGREGRILLKCHAGCEQESIVAALGLTMADLFEDATPAPKLSTIQRTYDYTALDGTLLFQTVRMLPKDFRQRRPDPTNPGRWVWNTQGVPLTLYHWPQHHDAPLIYLVEGEKDVETLEALGLAATTNPMGAKKWRAEYTQLLTGKTVVILPDNDSVGLEHSRLVQAALAPIATVRVLRLPIETPKGDVSDWVAAGGTRAELEALTADCLATPTAAPLPPTRRPPPQPTNEAPTLSTGSRCIAAWGHAGAWVDQYVAHSRRWSPRGLQSAHAAVALWVLSTIAARRVYCQVGSSEVYPVLFLAMVARSTLYAKSTTAALGRDVLCRAGCEYLLTADRTTPQALLRSMAGTVPANYGNQTEEDQEYTRKRLAFAGQRGSYFEEWGGMLAQMRRSDSPMADFHALLRVLDDNQKTYSNDTIQRGLERITSPYLALLASATPHDLAPFMQPGAPWWHDGFWPRFALITARTDEEPSQAQRERTGYHVPGSLLVPVSNWHRRLGIPTAEVAPGVDAQGKPTGHWTATISPLPSQELGIQVAVFDAYEAYNTGLITLLKGGDVPPDFDASYGRYHDKALRVALLLASLAGDTTISIQHWSYAQQIVETWRANLHTLTGTIEGTADPQRKHEEKILAFLFRTGRATGRDIGRAVRSLPTPELQKLLVSLVKTGYLTEATEGRFHYYQLTPEEDTQENYDPFISNDDAPF